MDTQLMLGNEAVARGAWEAGVQVAAAYPGTPSTEIVTSLARYEGVYAEWSTNEKVAYEVAFGASMGGARALTAMKSAGASVAADPLITSVYTGVNGGLVVCLAGDPGMASGMTEQDDRYFGRMSSMPMLEPADSQECYDFVRLAFDLSETYDVPVMVRLSIQTAHQKSIVRVGERRAWTTAQRDRQAVERKPPHRKTEKYSLLPRFSRPMHRSLIERFARLRSTRRRPPRPASWRAGPGAGPGRWRRLRARRRGDRRRRLHLGEGGAARGRLPQARHDPPAAGRGRAPLRGDRRPALRRRGARAVRRGAAARRRHRLRGQALVPAVGRAHAGARRARLRRGRPRPAALGRGEGRGGRLRDPAAARPLHRLPAPRHGAGDEEARSRRARRHRLLRPHYAAAGRAHALGLRDGREHPDRAGVHAGRRQRTGLDRRDRRFDLPALGPYGASQRRAPAHQRHRAHPGQPHHRHDGRADEPRQRAHAGGRRDEARRPRGDLPRARGRARRGRRPLRLPGVPRCAEGRPRLRRAGRHHHRPPLHALPEQGRRRGAFAVDEELCNACQLCMSLGCPSLHHVEATHKGRHKVAIDTETCAGCSLCEQLCRPGAITKAGAA